MPYGSPMCGCGVLALLFGLVLFVAIILPQTGAAVDILLSTVLCGVCSFGASVFFALYVKSKEVRDLLNKAQNLLEKLENVRSKMEESVLKQKDREEGKLKGCDRYQFTLENFMSADWRVQDVVGIYKCLGKLNESCDKILCNNEQQ